MQEIIEKVNIDVLHFVVTITSIVFVVDVITSIVKVKNIKPALERIEELNNEIKEKLAEIKSIRNEKSTEKSDIADNIQKIIDELNEKRNNIILRLYRNIYRLKKAFPAIDTEEIREILNRKIELKNLIRNKNDKK